MRKLRNSIIFSIILSVLACCITPIEAKMQDADVAYANFNKEEATSNNMAVYKNSGTSSSKVALRGGETGWVLDTFQNAEAQKIYVDLDKKFAFENKSGTEYEITITYYDEYNCWFTVEYDSEGGVKQYHDMTYGRNSGTWKKATYVLKDAYFGDRLEDAYGKKYDFCITSYLPKRTNTHGGGQNSVVIMDVNVKKVDNKNPINVEFSSNEIGNIFTNLTEKTFDIKFTNRLKTAGSYDLLYELKLNNGDVVWSKEDKLEINGNESISKTINPIFTKYGLYTLNVKVTNNNVLSSYSTSCSYSVQSEDGKRNNDYALNIHTGGQEGSNAHIDIMKKTNSGGIRDALYVFEWIYNQGSYSLANDFTYIVDLLNKNTPNDSVMILGYGNSYLTKGDIWTPFTTDAQFDEWEKYVRYVCETSGFSRYEVWNEPNYMGWKNCPEKYVELCKRTVKVVHEYNPDYKVAVGCIAAPKEEDDGFKFYNDLVDAGLLDVDFDALSTHPYTKVPEGQIEASEKYKKSFIDHGREDIELWYTEYGYTTGFRGGVTDAQTCNIITRQYLSMNARHLGEYWVRYETVDGNNYYDDEQAWGLVSSPSGLSPCGVPYAARPAFIVTANMNYLLRDAEVVGVVDMKDSSIETAHYKKENNDDLLAIWSTMGEKVVTLELGCDKVSIYDIYGNSNEISGENGKFVFTIGEEVKYLIGKFNKISRVDNEYEVDKITQKALVGDVVSYTVYAHDTEGLTINTELPSNMTLVKSTEFVNGKATVSVKYPTELVENINFDIILKRNGKEIQRLNLYGQCDEVFADITFNKNLEDSNKIKNWTGIIKIKNNSLSNLISGNLKFSLPKEFASLPAIKTGPIAAGDTAEIRVNFPTLKHLGIYTLTTTFNTEDSRTLEKSSGVDFTVATYAKSKPIIDGKINESEWNSEAAMYANDISQVKIQDGWKGINDLSAKCFVSWDEENLYFAAKVLDDTYYYDSKETDASMIWKDDSIQFGLLYGMANEVVMGNANRTFEEIGIGTIKGNAVVNRWSTQGAQPTGEIAGAESKIVREGNYTNYELRIPWTCIIPNGEQNPTNGSILGFSMLVNDNDGWGRRGWIEYASGIGLYKDTTLFTYIQLIK